MVTLACPAFTYGSPAVWTATFSDSDGGPLTVTWAIVRNGAVIPVADSDNNATALLTIQPDDLVRVTVTDSQGATASATSTTACVPTVPSDQPPSISLVKAASPTDLFGPGTVTFTYVVTNTGPVRLSIVGLTDDHGTPGDPSDDLALDDFDCGAVTQLAAGESVTCTVAYPVPGVDVVTTAVNTATVTGVPITTGGVPTGQAPVSDTAVAEVVIRPEVVEAEVIVPPPSPAPTPPAAPPAQAVPGTQTRSTPGQTLPVTGTSTSSLTWLALALIALGLVTVRVSPGRTGRPRR